MRKIAPTVNDKFYAKPIILAQDSIASSSLASNSLNSNVSMQSHHEYEEKFAKAHNTGGGNSQMSLDSVNLQMTVMHISDNPMKSNCSTNSVQP
jgi:hypothetical protein